MPPHELINYTEAVLPKWLPYPLTGEASEIISHFIILIHNNLIVPLSKSEHCSALYASVWLVIRLLKFIFNQQPKDLFSKIQAYSNLIQSNFNDEYFSKFCRDTFNLSESLSDVNNCMEEAYYAFTSIIFNCISKSADNFSVNKSFIDNCFHFLEKFFNNSEYELCIEVFKIFCSLVFRDINEYSKNDVVIFKNLHEKMEFLVKKSRLTLVILKTFDYISRILRNMKDYFEKIENEIWILKMFPEIQIEFMNIIHFVSLVLSSNEYRDNCSQKCSITFNYSQAVILSSISDIFMNMCVKCDAPYIEQIHKRCSFLLKDCCRNIEKLKIGGCEKWVQHWKMIGAIIFNIGSRLYRANNYKYAKIYYHLLSKYIILFEGIRNENSFLENSLGTSLHLISFCYINLKQYRSALPYIALGIQYCPNMLNKLWQNWCNAKSKANNDNIGNVAELTVRKILRDDVEVIKSIYPDYIFEPKQMSELLFLELQSYSKIWASKIPMNTTCKELFEICNDPFTRTLACILSWEKIIILQDEDFSKNLAETIFLLKKNTSLRNKVCLSALYYIDFQIKLYDILKKNLSEMNAKAPEEAPLVNSYDEPINPNDKCDIMPTYYNNKIEQNMNLHVVLNKCVDLWCSILDDSRLETVKELINEIDLSNMIKLTAYEYRLQNYTYQMLKIWFLYLKFGKIFKRKDIIVTAIGFILETINCETKTAKDLILSAEMYLEELITDNNYEIVATYLINKSSGFYYSNLLTDGYKYLCDAERLTTKIKNNILEARLLYTKSLYHLKPCNLKIIEHNQNYIVLAQNSFTTIAEFYKSGGNKCNYTLSILFDITLSIGNMYKWLKMPREVRCYTSETVLLAQQMVLPLRTTQLFSLLAFTDLLCLQFDDCKVKICGIDYILCYRNSNLNKVVENQSDCIVEINKDFEKLSVRNESFETMLDIPPEHKMKHLQGSPILPSKPFKIPDFIKHVDCTCAYCINVDYQILILECTHLEALFNMRKSNFKDASIFFKGGLNLYIQILNKLEMLKKNFSNDMIQQFVQQLNYKYCFILFDYSVYYAIKDNFNRSNELLKNIDKILGDHIMSNPYFFTEILMQKASLLTAIELKNFPVIYKKENELTVDNPTVLSKTPENKISVSKLPIFVSPVDEKIPKRKLKKLAFDIFNSDDEKDIPKSPPKNKYKFKTPLKTPAPSVSKVKMFTPVGKEKVQTMIMKISPKPSEIPKLQLSKSPLTASNSQSKKYDVGISATKTITDKRMKLLTEKLKAEQNGKVKYVEVQHKRNKTSHKENIPTRLKKNLSDNILENDAKEQTKINQIEKSQKNNTKDSDKTQYKSGDSSSSQENTRSSRVTRASNKK